MPVQLFLIEDSAAIQSLIERFLSKQNQFDIIGSAYTWKQARDKNYQNADILLCDIELPDGNSIEELVKQNYKGKVIFISSFSKYAVDAFELSAVDYVMKPIDPFRLMQALNKANDQLNYENLENQIHSLQNNLSTGTSRRLCLPVGNVFKVIPTNEIGYCSSEDSYTIFHLTTGEQILSSKTLKVYQEELYDLGFFRCHKSFLIPLSKVESFDKKNGVVCLIGGKEIPVSIRKRDELKEALQTFNPNVK